jgi:4-aminobutyrate aminotransferase-like enzyme
VGGQEGNVLRVQPPLVITQQELGRGLDVIDEALTTVTPRVPVR